MWTLSTLGVAEGRAGRAALATRCRIRTARGRLREDLELTFLEGRHARTWVVPGLALDSTAHSVAAGDLLADREGDELAVLLAGGRIALLGAREALSGADRASIEKGSAEPAAALGYASTSLFSLRPIAPLSS